MLLATFIDHIEMNLRFFTVICTSTTLATLINHAVISKDDLLDLSVVSV